jgi:hypothetical protein
LHKRLVPLISCDYLFITQKGIFSRNGLSEEERENSLTVLVIYCSANRSIFAHAVPKKGLGQDLGPEGYLIEQIRDDILWLGHHQIMIRSDNEPALLQVVDRALIALKAKGITSSSEGSVPYDPQTNGAAENAVRLLKGSLRVNLLSFERQIQARIPVQHPILTWLVTYAASVRNMRVRGQDSRTAQQLARGSGASTRLIPFGQVCRFKARSKEKGIGPEMTRWSSGIYLGIERRTGQYMIYDQKI